MELNEPRRGLRRMARVRVLILPALLLFTLPFESAAYAWPTHRTPLWDMVGHADLVVLAQVDKSRPTSLLVTEIWKGQSVGSPISVIGDPCYDSPRDSRFRKGRTAIAFLVRKGNAWEVGCFDDGLIYPSAEAVHVFRDRIKEATEIWKRAPNTPSERIDWIVRLTEHSATRWHGTFELAPRGDRLHAGGDDFMDEMDAAVGTGILDPRRAWQRQALAPLLTSENLRALADGFVRDTPTDDTLPRMLLLLRGEDDTRLDTAAADAVESVLANPCECLPAWFEAALIRTLRRLGAENEAARVEKLVDRGPSLSRQGAFKIWRQVRPQKTLPRLHGTAGGKVLQCPVCSR